MLSRRSLIAAAGACGLVADPARAADVTLQAADGVAVAADVRRATATRRGTILLFHMAGVNGAEYDPIAPRLNAAGFDTVATDQRSGGRAFGRANVTVERLGHATSFAAALTDLEAALAWARADAPGGPVLVWGSSYSAALVFVLAARHPAEVAAVLGFSPGEYIAGQSIRDAAPRVACPVFVTSASDPAEEAVAREILAASPARLKVQYRARAGVHGSSTLWQGRRAGVEDTWTAVLAFLDRAVVR